MAFANYSKLVVKLQPSSQSLEHFQNHFPSAC